MSSVFKKQFTDDAELLYQCSFNIFMFTYYTYRMFSLYSPFIRSSLSSSILIIERSIDNIYNIDFWTHPDLHFFQNSYNEYISKSNWRWCTFLEWNWRGSWNELLMLWEEGNENGSLSSISVSIGLFVQLSSCRCSSTAVTEMNTM